MKRPAVKQYVCDVAVAVFCAVTSPTGPTVTFTRKNATHSVTEQGSEHKHLQIIT